MVLKEADVMFATRRIIYREEGQGLVEYALIILLVAVAVVAGLTLFGGSVNSLYTTIAGAP